MKLKKTVFRIDNMPMIEVSMEYGVVESYNKKSSFYIRIPVEYQSLYEMNKEAKKYRDIIKQAYLRGGQHVIVMGETEALCAKNFREYLTEFNNTQSTIEDVILYRFDLEGQKIDNKRGYGGWSDGDAQEIKFTWKKTRKKSSGGKFIYLREDGREERYGVDRGIEIPYTPEAEAFMKSIEQGLDDMMLKIVRYTGTSNKMLTTIANATKLLS